MQFYKEWMDHPRWWMNATPQDDAYIVATYEYLLNQDISGEHPLLQIIVYDQLPRHIFRNQCASHIIDYYLHKALRIQINRSTLSNVEWVFASLPIRHHGSPFNIRDVLNEAWQRLKQEDSHLLRRFIKATYERMPRDENGLVQYCLPIRSKPLTLDPYMHILSHAPHHPPRVSMDELTDTLVNQMKQKTNVRQHIILSLSGGVDSMLASVALYNVRSKSPELMESLSAVHINYMNRGNISLSEEEFVKDWCKFLGIPLYVRRITEIHRPTAMKCDMRELYETYTKDVRMATYVHAGATCSNTWVVLGHNNDDCFENILTNIAKQQKYDNLKGMDVLMTNERGITFFRPWLEVTKSRIYEVAKSHAIPYVHNSTPAWSQRGKIRDIIRPTVHEWDPRFIGSSFRLAEHVQELTTVMTMYVDTYQQQTHKVRDGEWALHIHVTQVPTYTMFWHEYIKRMINIIASTKSLLNFKDRLHRVLHLQSISQTKVHINKQLDIHIRKICDQVLFTIVKK